MMGRKWLQVSETLLHLVLLIVIPLLASRPQNTCQERSMLPKTAAGDQTGRCIYGLACRLRGGRSMVQGTRERGTRLKGHFKYGGTLKLRSNQAGTTEYSEKEEDGPMGEKQGIFEEILLPEPEIEPEEEAAEHTQDDKTASSPPSNRKRAGGETSRAQLSPRVVKRLRKIGIKTQVSTLVDSSQEFRLTRSGQDMQDLKDEVQSLRQQAQRGNATAQLELAKRLLTGSKGASGPQNRRWKEAESWAQKALVAQHRGASEVVAYCHFVGAGKTSKDPRVAYRLWRAAAEGGSGSACAWVAHCLDQGIGVNRNRTEAVQWYEAAAINGSDPDAMYNVALCHYKGEGVPVNKTKAVQWLTLSSEYGRDEWVEVADGISELKSLGCSRAQLLLGLCYINGDGVEADTERGLDWLHKAGEQGEVDAMFFLGVGYHEGIGIEEPEDGDAYSWWEKASQNGCLHSTHNLAVLLAEGKGVKRNERKAASMLLSNADKGHKPSERLAALCYVEARGVKRDEEAGLQRYINATGVSTAQAQFEIGKRFVRGEGWLRAPNVERGIRWLRAAADQDHVMAFDHVHVTEFDHMTDQRWVVALVDAMVMLAPLLTEESSRGPKTKAFSSAHALLQAAADKGHPGAQVALGDYYKDGTGNLKVNVSRALRLWASAARGGSRGAKVRLADFMSGLATADTDKMAQLQQALAAAGPDSDGNSKDEIVRWLEMAAEEGRTLAQVELGKHLIEGSAEDQARAAVWFQRAATDDDGHPKAMFQLALCYLHGRGVPRKPEHGVRWLKAAAKGGDVEAMFSLSCCFAAGDGVEQRDDKAWLWLERAAEGGSASAMFNAYLRLTNGRGVEQNEAEGKRWLVLAARAGHVKAQYNYGLELLGKAKGVEEREEGKDMVRRATEQGHAAAAEVLKRLAGKQEGFVDVNTGGKN